MKNHLAGQKEKRRNSDKVERRPSAGPNGMKIINPSTNYRGLPAMPKSGAELLPGLSLDDVMGTGAGRMSVAGENFLQRQTFQPSAPTSQVIQCLMAGQTFTNRYSIHDQTRARVSKLLTKYESAWGYGYGTYFGEYGGTTRRQERLRILAELEQLIHEHFRDSGATEIKDAPESALMLELLDEVQAEHEKQIGQLLSYPDELPVSDVNLSRKDKKQVMDLWKSIVGGTGNLRVTEKEKNKGTGLERDHTGFRVKALSSIARLLQGAEGRKLINEANEGGEDSSQHITIAPISNKAYDVMERRGLWKQKKGTIPASGWDAEALDHSKESTKRASPYPTGTFWDLDADDDPVGTYELAAKQYRKRGDPDGVIIGRKKYLFRTN